MTDLENWLYSIKMRSQVKADDPWDTTVTGISNVFYGMKPWLQLNYEETPVNVTPSNVYRKSGFRAKTTDAVINTENGNTALGGMSERGKFPELVHGGYQQLEVDPKIVGFAYGQTLKQELKAQTEDDNWGTAEQIRADMAVEYSQLIPKQMMRDMETIAAAATAHFKYSSAQEVTPFDQSISSDAEEDAIGGTYNGLFDAYGDMDRDSGTTYDSTVITCNEGGTIGGANGVLDRTHFSEMTQKILTNSGRRPSFYLMSYSVQAEIQHLYDGQVIYDPSKTISVGTGGVGNGTGLGVQQQVAAIEGIPIVSSKYATKRANDTDQEGHIFAICTDAMGSEGNITELSVLLPTVDTSVIWGMTHQDLITRTGLVTMLEQVNHQPNASGKFRDIKRRS